MNVATELGRITFIIFSTVAHVAVVHGGWSVWTTWADCSVDCGTGLTHRKRLCDNQTSSSCCGESVEYDLCLVRSCAVNGSWSEWGNWGPCSVTCGPGLRHRQRTCSYPEPSNGGRSCDGDTRDYTSCQNGTCAGCAFTAVHNAYNHYYAGDTIKFDTVITNEGHDYDFTTGIFTAPTAGMYVFTVTIMVFEATADVYLMKGTRERNVTIGHVYPDDYNNPFSGATASVTVTVRLNQGNMVFARYNYGKMLLNYSLSYMFYCFFSGFLL